VRSRLKTAAQRHLDALMAEYVKKRNAAVRAAVERGDLSLIKALAIENKQPIPPDPVLEISAHKMCCEILTMPDELRKASADWLKARGFAAGIRY
jgi:hypothetical protein